MMGNRITAEPSVSGPEMPEQVPRRPETVDVPGGVLHMGSSLEEVDRCATSWAGRLIDATYATAFRDWILKEYPKHAVEISPFVAMRYPVSNDEYARSPTARQLAPESIRVGCPGDHPVWNVSLADAVRYATWLSETSGVRWRLPTEPEWEWMARGPKGLEYPFGAVFSADRCNTIESGRKRTVPRNRFDRHCSWCGVSDLAGNVEEWTASVYAPYPGGQFIEDDLVRLVGRQYPILRGGSFLLGGDLCRGARRHGPHPGEAFRVTGLRLVHDPPPEQPMKRDCV